MKPFEVFLLVMFALGVVSGDLYLYASRHHRATETGTQSTTQPPTRSE